MSATPFYPTFNCPTHFAVGDPECAACRSKQPPAATPVPAEAPAPCTKCNDSGLIWVEVCHPTQTRCSCQPAPSMVVTATNGNAQFVAYSYPGSPVPVGTTAPGKARSISETLLRAMPPAAPASETADAETLVIDICAVVNLAADSAEANELRALVAETWPRAASPAPATPTTRVEDHGGWKSSMTIGPFDLIIVPRSPLREGEP